MSQTNIEDLSVAELSRLKKEIDKAMSTRRHSELLEMRNKVDKMVTEAGFTLQEIINAKAMRKPAKPKYRDPNDPDQTWTGRGRRPRWVEELVQSGTSLESLLIK